jgi:hypothetical protein
VETAKVDLSDWIELVLLRIGDKVLGVIAGDLKGVVGVLILDLEFEIMLLNTMTYIDFHFVLPSSTISRRQPGCRHIAH